MTEVKWIKLSTNIFDDETIKLIEQMPEGDAIIVIWFKLLVKAGLTNNNGLVYLKENIPYTEEMLATVFNKPLATIRLALRVFEQFKMIEITNANEILIKNWEKHQNVAGMEQIREYNRLAKRKQRQKQKELIASRIGKNVPNIDNADNKIRFNGNYYDVLNRDGYMCRVCGSEDEIRVHHIDGYRENKPENNEMNKLITLCRSCHASVHSGMINIESIKNDIGYYECQKNVNDIQGQSNKCHETDKDKDIDIEEEKENNISLSEDKSSDDISKGTSITMKEIKEFVNLYNSTVVRLSKVEVISETRKNKIKARLKNISLSEWKKVFEKMEASDFCCGINNKNWKASFDWILTNDNNYVKVLEGRYDNKKGAYNVNNSSSLNELQKAGMDIL